jgi:hypothetical protein
MLKPRIELHAVDRKVAHGSYLPNALLLSRGRLGGYFKLG